MEEGESVGKALAVRGQSTYCTLHSQQLRFKTTFFTFCHHICRLLTLSLLFPPIFYSQQCKLHFKHSDKLNTQQFSENETEQEQRPAGLQQGGIHSAMHTGPSGVLWVRVCAALITGRAELCIHLAARHTQMEGGGGSGTITPGSGCPGAFLKGCESELTAPLSLYSPSLSRLQLFSAVCLARWKAISLSSGDGLVRCLSVPRFTNLFSFFFCLSGTICLRL